jgi:hypothetical protein
MSTEYEVHGPHGHEVEHSMHQRKRDRLTGAIAVTTAILATVGAIFAYQGGAAESQALYYKNEEAIAKTEAANQWSYYQAKGEKQNLAELGAVLAASDPQKSAHFAEEIHKYQQQKEQIRAKAQELEQQVALNAERSEGELHLHHRWAQGTMLIQVSISLAAICLLTRRRWMLYATYGVAASGGLVGLSALLHFHLG